MQFSWAEEAEFPFSHPGKCFFLIHTLYDIQSSSA
jgi:hypothetical protein